MAEGIYIEARSMEELGRKLRLAGAVVEARMAPAMVEVGRLLEKEARQIAEDNGSQKVADSVKTLVIPRGVEIQAGGPDAPVADLWELGNKGKKVSEKTFRHPVFGSKTTPWVTQEKKPFLRPARRKTAVERRAVLEAAWEEAMRPLGLRIDWEGFGTGEEE